MNNFNFSRRRDPLWDELAFIPAQLARPPLLSHAEADLETVIGKRALVPLRLSMPLVISHMSHGSVSAEFKCEAARAASAAGIATGSGEGGVLKNEIELSSAYIFEHTPGLFGLTQEVLDRCAAVEIKIGRSDLGPLGEELPGGLPNEVYMMRNAEPGPFTSLGRFAEINTPSDLKIMVDGLREGCGGKPVGLKLAAGRIENDLDFAIKAGVDFVTVDGRSTCGGELGGPCLPTMFAISRAARFLKSRGSDIDIIAAGGMRTAADFAKAIALGATAAASASSVIEAAETRLGGISQNIGEWLAEVKTGLMRICAFTGRTKIGELSSADLAALSFEAGKGTGVQIG